MQSSVSCSVSSWAASLASVLSGVEPQAQGPALPMATITICDRPLLRPCKAAKKVHDANSSLLTSISIRRSASYPSRTNLKHIYQPPRIVGDALAGTTESLWGACACGWEEVGSCVKPTLTTISFPTLTQTLRYAPLLYHLHTRLLTLLVQYFRSSAKCCRRSSRHLASLDDLGPDRISTPTIPARAFQRRPPIQSFAPAFLSPGTRNYRTFLT